MDPDKHLTEDGDGIVVSSFFRVGTDDPIVSLTTIDANADEAVAIMTPAEAVKLGWSLLHQAASLGWVEDEQ